MAKNNTGITNKTTLVKIDSPKQVAAFAKELKGFIVKNNLYTTIKKKNFVHVEGWQFAGASMGFSFIPTSVEDQSTDREIKYMAQVDMIRMSDSVVIGRGFAICSNKEQKKITFDDYAVHSMAQTRAIGKAGRNTLGWVMKLAGYEPTPAEEVTENVLDAELGEKSSNDQNDVDVNDIKYLVDLKLGAMNAADKVKLLHTHCNVMNTKSLTDDNYRYLYTVLSEKENESK